METGQDPSLNTSAAEHFGKLFLASLEAGSDYPWDELAQAVGVELVMRYLFVAMVEGEEAQIDSPRQRMFDLVLGPSPDLTVSSVAISSFLLNAAQTLSDGSVIGRLHLQEATAVGAPLPRLITVLAAVLTMCLEDRPELTVSAITWFLLNSNPTWIGGFVTLANIVATRYPPLVIGAFERYYFSEEEHTNPESVQRVKEDKDASQVIQRLIELARESSR